MTWKEEIKKAPLKDFQRRMARHKDGLMPEATPPASKITLDEALAEIKARREPNPKHIEVLEELIELLKWLKDTPNIKRNIIRKNMIKLWLT